jgi:hypothetical protein
MTSSAPGPRHPATAARITVEEGPAGKKAAGYRRRTTSVPVGISLNSIRGASRMMLAVA